MGKVWVNIPVRCLKRPGDQCAWPTLYIVIDLNIATIAKKVWWHSLHWLVGIEQEFSVSALACVFFSHGEVGMSRSEDGIVHLTPPGNESKYLS